MTTLILLILLPTQPRDPGDFNNDLQNLEITVNDLTVGDDVNNTPDGVQLAVVQGVLPSPYYQRIVINAGATGQSPTLATPILQHYVETLDSFGNPEGPGALQSVATAVITVNTPPAPAAAGTSAPSPKDPDPEYGSRDLQITLARNGNTINPTTIQYNAYSQPATLPLSSDPAYYIAESYPGFDTTANYPSTYVFVPPAPPANTLIPGIKYAADGKTPTLDSLVPAVNAVLAADYSSSNKAGDPTDLINRPTPLTAQQARRVADELTYVQGLNNLPFPKTTPSIQVGPLEDMYTAPNGSNNDNQNPGKDIYQNRVQFEASLKQYYAVNDAAALQLASFILAASASIKCEQQSLAANTAGVTVSVEVSPPPPGTVAQEFSVIIQGTQYQATGALTPPFGVPAAFFYALGASASVDADWTARYSAATIASESATLGSLTSAKNLGIIQAQELYLTITTPPPPPGQQPGLDINQAARQLAALGVPITGTTIPPATLNNSISGIMTAWIQNPDSLVNIGTFWLNQATSANPSEYLDLLWLKICAEQTTLGSIIQSALSVNTASDLLNVSDQAWTTFWNGQTAGSPTINLLPLYTSPGTPAVRIKKFIHDLRMLFTVKQVPPPNPTTPTETWPMLQSAGQDALALYFSQAGSSFSFKNSLVESTIQAVLQNIPVDQDISNWIDDALHVISFLYTATSTGTLNTTPPALQFSYMEALYARGFINESRVALLTRAQFQAALAGTVAYPVSGAIYDNATSKQADPTPGQEPGSGFTSVNSGSLVNCCPPLNLSPFGPIEYLHELLNLDVTVVSTNPTTPKTQTLMTILSGRRGPVGNLKATMANLEYEVPMIDLVNESLENLATVSSGQVNDTPYNTIAGFAISGDQNQIRNHVLEAIPQYSPPLLAPATLPTIYQSLATDYSAPILPYSLELDVNRTYLSRLSCQRFDEMRVFRQKITEFALDPTNEPSGFLSYEWRLPVRLEIATEYLQMSQQELQDLWLSQMTDAKLLNLYGFANDGQSSGVSTVDSLITALGISYCEFLELTRAGLMSIRNNSTDAGTFPDCPSCCLSQLRIGTPSSDSDTGGKALVKLAATTADGFFTEIILFVRLWRMLQRRYGKCCISMALLAQICLGLNWFSNNQVDPNFIRQLLALLMLCDLFRISLHLETDVSTGSPPYQYVKILALWSKMFETSSARVWAVDELLSKVMRCSQPLYPCCGKEGHAIKLLGSDLDTLSTLVGFTTQIPWNANPECTLRFSEIQSKIVSSPFSVGDIEFIYTVGPIRQGDDPFEITDASGAGEDPLEHPQDDHEHDLWHLRQKLLEVHVSEEEACEWSWHRIEHILRDKFGMQPTTAGSTSGPLQALAEHFFPDQVGSSSGRQFRTGLAAANTTPSMWKPPNLGPFHYDSRTQELWTALPLTDEAVLKKLAHVRQLRATGTSGNTEEKAVRELYFAPRAMLAPFGFLFENFSEAVQVLVQSESKERWHYFRANFARFYRRCEVIADHLACHVKSVGDCCDDCKHRCTDKLAWRVLQSLYADENSADGQWEKDNGQPPAATLFAWDPHSTGCAFAALVGLTGTGLAGEYKVKASSPVAWKEIRGPIDTFGWAENTENVPVPTILPALSYAPTTSTPNNLVMFRNGFGLSDVDADNLGGASPFEVTWSGVLLVHESGEYHFEAQIPCCRRDGHEDDCKCGEAHLRWQVRLKRGSKSWVLLSHRSQSGGGGPAHKSKAVHLLHGTYDIEILYEQDQPDYDEPEDLFRRRTGFMLQYCGPDSEYKTITIPINKLYINEKDGTLASGFDFPVGNAKTFLTGQYVSTLRDIRRTYLRAFKALLIASRFHLEAHQREHSGGESEIGFLLDHPDRFAGTSFYQTPPSTTWQPHMVYFDFNFLPVFDTYFPPTNDTRANPKPQRVAALFDCWERLFDYKRLVKRVEEGHHHARHHIVPWRMFQEAASQQPSPPDTLLRYLGVDIDIAPLCLKYFDGYTVQDSDLSDERWAVRAWHASKTVHNMKKNLYSNSYDTARPDLWASDSPDKVVDNTTTPPLSGNNNLVQLVDNACIRPDSRLWKDIKKLNGELRERVRDAMVAYYIQLDRVQLPTNFNAPYATSVADLSDLLLQDVSTSLCKQTTRIQDAICAAQTFIQRLQIGLESNYIWTGDLAKQWSSSFESYETWKLYKRWQIYPENYVQVDEVEKARKCEAFRFLEERISNHELTLPKSSPGFALMPDGLPGGGKDLKAKQWTDFARLSAMNNAVPDEGVDLIGTPYFYAQQSWLAPLNEVIVGPPSDGGGENGGGSNPPPSNPSAPPAIAPKASKVEVRQAIVAAPIRSGPDTSVDPGDNVQVPMWFKAAVRLGTRFLRIAASGLPLGVRSHIPQSNPPPSPPDGHSKEKDDVPNMDEYYFWLIDGRWFDGNYIQTEQVAEIGVQLPDTTSDWDRPDKLPNLLIWTSNPLVHLAWTRVRLGTFDPPCYSAEGVPLDPAGGPPVLTFSGRTVDSLNFTIEPPDLPGYPGGSFRYDLATNFAVALPQALQVNAPTPQPPLPDPLPAFPYFVYFEPGTPLIPISSFATILSIAGALQSHCRFDEALAWLRTLYDPLNRDNTLWTPCPVPRSEHNDTKAIAIPITEPGDPLNQYSGYVRARAVLMTFIQDLLQWAEKFMCENTSESISRANVLFNAAARILGPTPLTNAVKVPDQNITATISNYSPSKAPLNPQLLQLYGRVTDNRLLIQNCLGARRLSLECWPGELVPRDKGCSCADTEHSWRASCVTGCNSCCLPYRFTSMYQKAMEAVNMVKGFSTALLNAFEKGDGEYLAALRQTHEKWILDLSLEKMKNAYRESDWQVQAVNMQIEGALANQRYYQGLHDQGLIQGELAHVDLTNQSLQSRSSANTVEATGQTMNFIPDIQIGGAGTAGSPFNANKIPLGTKLAGAFSAGARLMNTTADSQSTDAGLSATSAGWVRRDADWQQQIQLHTIESDQLERTLHAAQRRRDMALRDLNNHQEQIQQSADISHFMRSKLTKQDLYLYMQQVTASLYRRAYELALQNAWDAQAAFQYERRDLQTMIKLPLPAWNTLREGLMAADELDFAMQNMQRLYLKTNCREYELTKHLSLRQQFPLAFLQLRATGSCEIDIAEWMLDLDYPGHYMRRIKNVSLTLPCVAGPYTGVHCRLQQLSSGIRLTPELPGPMRACCTGKCEDDEHAGCCCSYCGQSGSSCYEDYDSLSRQYVGTEAIALSSGQNDSGLFELNFHDERFVPFEFSGAVSRWRLELPQENNMFPLHTVSDVVVQLNYTAREGGKALRQAASRVAQKHLPGDGIRFFDVRHEFPQYWQAVFGREPEEMYAEESYDYDYDYEDGDNGEKDHGDHDEHGDHHHGREGHHDGGHDGGKHHCHSDGHAKKTQGKPHPGRGCDNDSHRCDLPLVFTRRLFPFLPCRRPVAIVSLHVFVETERAVGDCAKHFTTRWLPPRRTGCEERWRDFECAAAADGDMCGFYHGVLGRVRLGPIRDGDDSGWRGAEGRRNGRTGHPRFGYLRFPEELRCARVRQVYLLCEYVADDGIKWCPCGGKSCVGCGKGKCGLD